MTLDYSIGAKPLWSQLAAIIRKDIEDGVYKVGETLPSEMQLIEQFGVSRVTVRQAMERLMTEGYIIRMRGKGTIVQSSTSNKTYTRVQSSFKQLEEQDRSSIRVVDSVSYELAPQKACEIFNIATDTKIIKLKRSRKIDGKIVTIFETYLNPSLSLTLKSDFEGSLYKLLESEGYEVTGGNEILSAYISSEKDMQEFSLDKLTAIIDRTKIGYSRNTPIEYTISRYLSDGYKLLIDLV